MSEQDEFLKDLEKDENTDPFASTQPEETEKEPEGDDPEEQPESVKDRRHRRLESRLQAERESNIALSERLKLIAEAKEEASGEAREYLKSVERIYGTDTPEASAATELLKSALRGVKDEAKAEAIATIREEQERAQAEVKEAEGDIDSMLEEIEDQYGVDLTTNAGATTRKSFLTLLERMSPKDSEGNIIAYADPEGVWEALQSRKKPETRAKDLASRAGTQSGQSGESTLQVDATERWLRDQGII